MKQVFFPLTRGALARIRLSIYPLLPRLLQDLRTYAIGFISNILRSTSIHKDVKALAIKFGVVKPLPLINASSIRQFQSLRDKPIIFTSYCAGPDFPGSRKFCGGTKELHCLIKLLRERGYEAYIVTYDGSYEPWLLDHQPHISLNKFQEIVRQNNNIRCVTSWAAATAFIQASPSVYFWDMELAFTEHEHFSVLAKLYRHKIENTAAISRTIQAWHMAHFQRSCVLIPNLLDTSLWSPTSLNHKKYRIGYMDEGAHTEDYLNIIRNFTQEKGFKFEFHLISGDESEILAEMHTCEVFLSMNIGKDALWGEGCPRTVIEALASGCVVIAFDIIGNRETIQDNFNGVIVTRYCPDLMAESLVKVYTSTGEMDRLRDNSWALIKSCHTFDARWSSIKEFLNL